MVAPVTTTPKTAEFRSYLVAPLLRFARRQGADVSELCRTFELPADAEQLPEVQLPVPRLAALFDAAAAMLGDPWLGVNLAQQLSTQPLDLLQYTCLNAPTLRDALTRVARTMPLFNDRVAMHFSQHEGQGILTHAVPGHAQGLGRHGNELWMVLIVLRSRMASAAPVVPLRACFVHPGPGGLGPLPEVLGTDQIEFDAPDNAVHFDAATLDLPFPRADPALLSLLDRVGSEALVGVQADRGLVGDVAREIQRRLADGVPTVAEVARALALSPRTLQRRLTDEGTRFAAVLDDVREQLARQYLRRGWSATETALALGYADTTAFSRAFRRWSGTTPAQFVP